MIGYPTLGSSVFGHRNDIFSDQSDVLIYFFTFLTSPLLLASLKYIVYQSYQNVVLAATMLIIVVSQQGDTNRHNIRRCVKLLVGTWFSMQVVVCAS